MTVTQETEEWRPISWAPGYDVSNFGCVGSWRPLRNFASAPTERRLLNLAIDKYGYRRAVLYLDGRRHQRVVSSLVCEAWHGQRPPGHVVRHLDGTRDNNRPENLAWGTPQENSADAIAQGTMPHGVSVNTSKLTEENVIEILLSEQGHSALARKFGVTPGAIWHIRDGRTWKHVSINYAN